MTRRLEVLVSVLSLGVGLTRPAVADPQECIAANERGSELKARGELRAARAEYQACSAEDCPKVIRDECDRLVGVIEAATPTVVLVALDAEGSDAIGVRVEIDGRRHDAGIDGRAAALDPGEHTFRFQRGSEVREVRAIMREGEKNRPVRAQFGADTKPPNAAPPQPTIANESRARPVPTLAYLLAGVGVAALGSFAYFAVKGNAQKNDLLERCAPSCTLDEADSMQAKYLAADVSLAVAAVSLGSATYLYVTRPPAADPGASVLQPPGLQLGVRGTF